MIFGVDMHTEPDGARGYFFLHVHNNPRLFLNFFDHILFDYVWM